MYKNGISHLTAPSDLEGALQIINYLMFIPESRGRAIPILPTGDSWDRNVDYKPPKGPYDPRQFLAGCYEDVEGTSTWKSGILDNGSFFETMGKSADGEMRSMLTSRWMGSDYCHRSWTS